MDSALFQWMLTTHPPAVTLGVGRYESVRGRSCPVPDRPSSSSGATYTYAAPPTSTNWRGCAEEIQPPGMRDSTPKARRVRFRTPVEEARPVAYGAGCPTGTDGA